MILNFGQITALMIGLFFVSCLEKMLDLPENFPYYCNDIQNGSELEVTKKFPSRDKEEEHHALNDAWDVFKDITF